MEAKILYRKIIVIRWFVTFILVSLLVSCVGIVDVHITGSLKDGIAFSLYKHDTNDLIDDVSVRYVYVDDVTETEPKPVWRLTGNAVVSTIRYGNSVSGLKQDMGPETLLSGRLYRVSIGISTKPPSSGGGHFCFENSGELVRLKSFEEVEIMCGISP